MTPLHIVSIQPRIDRQPTTDGCGVALAKGRASLAWPALPAAADPPSDEPPYPVDILLEPRSWNRANTSQITVNFPAEPRQMHLAMRKNAVAAYALGSWFQLDQLGVGVFGLKAFGKLLTGQRNARPDSSDAGAALMDKLRTQVSKDRLALFDCFLKVRTEIGARREAILTLVQAHSACRAVNVELPACDRITLNEGRRYLALARTDDADVRAVLRLSGVAHAQALTGPEGRALVAAMSALRPLYLTLQAAKADWERERPAAKLAREASHAALLGAWGGVLLIKDALELVKRQPAPSPQEQAMGRLTDAMQAFQSAFAAQAVRYPILFKVGDALGSDEQVWTRRIVEALADSLDASRELADKIRSDASLVWRFPGLIDRTLRSGFSTEAAMASRVVTDELLRRNEMPPFARLNAGLQILTAPTMFVPFPAVELAAGIAAVLGDAAEMIESWFRTAEQRLGFRASLDPALSLGPDASYASTVAQAAALALDVLAIPGALKNWAKEGAEAARATAARDLANASL